MKEMSVKQNNGKLKAVPNKTPLYTQEDLIKAELAHSRAHRAYEQAFKKLELMKQEVAELSMKSGAAMVEVEKIEVAMLMDKVELLVPTE